MALAFARVREGPSLIPTAHRQRPWNASSWAVVALSNPRTREGACALALKCPCRFDADCRSFQHASSRLHFPGKQLDQHSELINKIVINKRRTAKR